MENATGGYFQELPSLHQFQFLEQINLFERRIKFLIYNPFVGKTFPRLLSQSVLRSDIVHALQLNPCYSPFCADNNPLKYMKENKGLVL